MKFWKSKRVCHVVFITIFTSFTIAACGGGGGGGSSPVAPATVEKHSVSAVVTGLDGSVTLNNGDDEITADADGTYTLSSDQNTGSTYSVSISSQPADQTCSVANGNGTIGSADVDEIFVNCAALTPESHIVDNSEVSDYLVSSDTDSLTFSSLPNSLAGLAEGDVIYADVTSKTPEGLLRKVVSVSEIGGQTVVQTENALLSDLLINGGFQYKGKISSSQATSASLTRQFSNTATLRAVSNAADYCNDRPSDFVIDFRDHPISASVSISGCAGVNLDLDVGAKFSPLRGVKNFHFIVGSTVSNALSVTVSPSVNLSAEYSQPIQKFLLPIPAGPISIPAWLNLNYFYSIGGEASASATVGIGTSLTTRTGAIIENDVLQIVKEFTPSFEMIGPEVSSTVSVTAAYGPEINYKIFDIAGPQIALAAPEISLNANIGNDPWWDVKSCLKGTLDLTVNLNEIKGFGKLSNSWGLNYSVGEFYKKCNTIAQAPGPYDSGNSAPTAQFSFSPLSPATGQSVTFTNTSTDPDGDQLTWNWNFGDGSTSTLKNPTHTYSTADTYQVGLEAIDQGGLTDTKTDTITVSQGGSGGTLFPPNNVSLLVMSTTELYMQWELPQGTSNITAYTIYDYPSGNEIIDLPYPTLVGPFSFSTFDPNTEYCFTVASRDANYNYSSMSDFACAKTIDPNDTIKPSAPSNLTVFWSSDSSLTTAFDPSTDNDTPQNRIHYRKYVDGTWTTSESLYDVSNGSSGPYDSTKSYCIYFTAVDLMGNESLPSNEVCVEPYGNSNYKTFNIAGNNTWQYANDVCTNFGGYLASITSQAEDDELTTLIQNEVGSAANNVLIGLNKLNGSWEWTSGEALAYRNWHPREPNQGYNYVSKWMGGPNNTVVGAWNDILNIPDYIVCEKDSAAGGGTTTFGTVTSAGQIWMDRNLGASQVATTYDDAAAYGDLYQWGRGTDGHEKRDSPTTTTLSSSDTPGHGRFIAPTSSPSDWRNPQNDILWQGVDGVTILVQQDFVYLR